MKLQCTQGGRKNCTPGVPGKVVEVLYFCFLKTWLLLVAGPVICADKHFTGYTDAR